MADVPDNRRVYFEPRITLGNLLTIFGGVVFAIGLFSNLNSKLDDLGRQVSDIRCAMTAYGIAPTTSPCTLSPVRAPIK